MVIAILAQTTASAEAGSAAIWWHVLVDNALALTILLIFTTAILAALVNAWGRDKCLKLVHDYHVTYLNTNGKPVWGDLIVYSRGIELRFDAPYVTRLATTKSSALIYPDELKQCLAICRVSSALTEKERRQRTRQVTRTFNPGLTRRGLRLVRNIVSVLRDAVVKSLGALLGQAAKARPALVGGKGELEEFGKTLLGRMANSYEPILERHIGRPVLLGIEYPAHEEKGRIELPGYLVDYTDEYVAVFNVDQEVNDQIDVEAVPPFERPGLKLEAGQGSVAVHATGPQVLIVKRVGVRGRDYDLDVVLLPGSQVHLACDPGQPIILQAELALRIDVVCPRSIATVHFGSDTAVRAASASARPGLAPEEENDQAI